MNREGEEEENEEREKKTHDKKQKMIQIKQKSKTKKRKKLAHKHRTCICAVLGKISVTEIMNEKIIRKRVTNIVQKRSCVRFYFISGIYMVVCASFSVWFFLFTCPSALRALSPLYALCRYRKATRLSK